MAKWQKKKIQDEGAGFGQYKESVGGGASPEKGDPSKHGHGVNSDHRKANNDTMQPRTDDGKFTYKSVNGQSINPKYGPSRGETVNPLLTGGENGVKISDVESEFSSQSGAIWDKYKDKWYQKGSEVVTSGDFKVHVSAEAIWNVAKRRYDKVKGEFQREGRVFAETKKGRLGKEEQAAKQAAKKSGEEQAVLTSLGAIKVKPGTVQNFPSKPSPSAGANNTNKPFVKSQPAPTPVPVAPVNKLKHTKEQLDSARKLLGDAGVDTSGFTDEQLDQIVDDYIDFSEE